MYLTKLFRHNKLLFAAIVIFIVMQLLVTYKRGMVISPWYNYGMYSEKIYPKQVYEVNKRLGRPEWFYLIAPQYDDKTNLTLDNYRKLTINDSLYQKEIRRLFIKFHFPVPAEKYYQSRFDTQAFKLWFQQFWWISKSTLQSPTHYKIFATHAIWDGNELKIPRGFLSDSNGTIFLP